MRKFRLREDRLNLKAGEIVYDFLRHDYGLATQESLFTQIPHISVTRHSDGGEPFVTVPTYMLEEITVVH